MPTAIRRQSTVCVVAIAMLAAPMAVAQPCRGGAGLAPEVVQGFALPAKYDSNGLGAEAAQAQNASSYPCNASGYCRSFLGLEEIAKLAESE